MQRFICLSVLVCALVVSGCGDAAYWHQRTFYGIDCRPNKLKDGWCTDVKTQASTAPNGAPSATTALKP